MGENTYIWLKSMCKCIDAAVRYKSFGHSHNQLHRSINRNNHHNQFSVSDRTQVMGSERLSAFNSNNFWNRKSIWLNQVSTIKQLPRLAFHRASAKRKTYIGIDDGHRRGKGVVGKGIPDKAQVITLFSQQPCRFNKQKKEQRIYLLPVLSSVTTENGVTCVQMI